MAKKTSDPLHIIFTKHLYYSYNRNIEDLSRIVFEDYMNYLRCSGANLTKQKENILTSEVKDEINSLLLQVLSASKSLRSFLQNLPDLSKEKTKAEKSYLQIFNSVNDSRVRRELEV